MARPIRIYGDDDPRSVLPMSEEGWPEELGARIATPDKSPAARKAALKAALDLSPEDKSLDPARQALRNLATVSVEQGEPVILSRKPMPQAKPRPLSAEQGQDILAGIKGAVPEAMAKAGLEQPKQEALAEAPGVAPLPVREFQKMAMGGAGPEAARPPAPPQAPPEQPAAPRPLRPEVTAYLRQKVAPQEPQAPTADEEKDAQERSRWNEIAAAMGRGGEKIGAAIAGTRADTSTWDRMRDEAGKPLGELEKRRALVREHLKEKAAADLRERGFKLQEDDLTYRREKDAATAAGRKAEQEREAADKKAARDLEAPLKEAQTAKLRAEIEKLRRTPSGKTEDPLARRKRELEIKKLEKELEGGGGPNMKAAGDLRREMEGLSRIKAFHEIAPMKDKIKRAAQADSPAGDLLLMFSYMKIVDPGSVVRESEFRSAGEAGNLPQRVQVAFDKWAKGTRLTPEQRNDFVRQAESAYASHEDQYKSDVRRYRDLAARSGADPDDVALESGRGGTETKGGLDLGGAQAGGQQDSAAVQWAKANPNDPRAAKILEMNGVR
jgi:hypothetical protein